MNSQVALLWVIDEWNGSSVASVANVLGMETGDIIRDVMLLARDGLIDMRRAGNRTLLCITDAGVGLLQGTERPDEDENPFIPAVKIPDWVF